MSMTNPSNRVEVITSIQRRRRWTALEKVRMVGSGAIQPGDDRIAVADFRAIVLDIRQLSGVTLASKMEPRRV